jgi:hypothetical protein
MKRLRNWSAAACVCCCYCCWAARFAEAQHADVSPRVSGGRIVTDAFEDAAGTPTPGVRVFGYDFQEDPLDPYFAADPGFNAPPGSGLPAGSQLRFNILDGSSFGLASNLAYWNGSGEVAFGRAPAGETLTFTLGAQSRAAGGATGEVAGFAFATASSDGSLHRHLNSLLQGADGNTDPSDGTVPADGIYLVPLELASSDAGVADSLPLFLVFNNGLPEETHDRAMGRVQSTLVPEPASLGLLGLAGVALLRRPRGRMTMA